MDKQLFDDAIGEVPRSTIDLDAAISRGRRAARLRRVANPAAAAGLAVVLAAGAVAFTMTGDNDTTTGVGSPPTSTTSSEAPPTKSTSPSTTSSPPGTAPNVPEPKAPEACSRTDLESAAEVSTRLTSTVNAAVLAQRPDIQLSPNRAMREQGGALEFFQSTRNSPYGADAPICEKFSDFQGFATADTPQGKGNISMAVGATYYPQPPQCEQIEGDERFCETGAGPNGVFFKKETSPTENGVTVYNVSVLRPEGVIVNITAENVGTSVKQDDESTAALPPLSYDQMIAVASAPGLTLFP
jgi:hypothetical protein